jgi:hypothetical protein
MNVHEPYLTDSEFQSIAKYVEILMNVSNRVSSRKVAPLISNIDMSLGRGLIDKLIIHLPISINIEELRVRCELLGYKVIFRYLGDKRYYMSIDCNSLTIDCFLGRPDNTEIYKIITNPSKVKHWSIIEILLLKIFNKIVLDSKIYRMDCTVDYFEVYMKLLKGLDIKYKRANVEFHGNSIRSGMLIGDTSGNDKISIYNKAELEKVKYPWTRIERQLTGAKVIVNRLGELKYSADKIIKFDPLAIVSLNNINFLSEKKLTTERLEKFNELKALIKYEGYFLARKKLDIQRHFKREYGDFFTLTPYLLQPREIFNRDILTFFKETIQ